MSLAQARFRRRRPLRPAVGPVVPVGEVIPLSDDLKDRLTLGGLVPEAIADAIVNAYYEMKDGTKVYLFTTEKLYEVQEVIGIYDKFREDYSNEADAEFIKYIETLKLTQEKKSRKDLFLDIHDLVFETPYLAEFRRQENVKLALASRRRRPARGISCRRGGCSSNEVYLEEKFTRSGDESGVITYVCAKCDHQWKK